MQNTNKLGETLKELEHEAQQENQEINLKTAELNKIKEEEERLTAEIRQMEAKIKQDEAQLSKDERLASVLPRELQLLKDKQLKNHADLARIQRDLEEAARQTKMNELHHTRS